MPNHDVRSFMENVKPEVLELYEREEFRCGFKTRFILNVEMERRDLVTGEVTTVTPYFHSQSQIVLEYTDVSEIYDVMVQQIVEEMTKFNKRGSNWALRSIIGLDILMDSYSPLGGGSYIPLPSKLAKKNAIVNQKNEDDKCFKWSVTIGLDPADVHPERITQRVKDNSRKLCWDGVEFPAKEEDVRAFERANPDIAINYITARKTN